MSTIKKLIVGILVAFIVFFTSNYHTKVEHKKALDVVMSKISPATFNQKEFPRPFIEYMADYCINTYAQAYKAFSNDEQRISYCACVQEQIVQHFTMKEYIPAMNSSWNPKVVPDAVKKDDEVIAECLQKSLGSH